MHCNFKIYFDFNRSSVEFINPNNGGQYTRGLCEYVEIKSFYLYIAAKELSNDGDDKFSAYGSLAHELCHFAMNLTFCNDAMPYAIDDEKNKERFQKIIENYKVILSPILDRKCKIKRLKSLISFCDSIQNISPDELNNFKNDCEAKITWYQEVKEKLLICKNKTELIQGTILKLNKCIERMNEKNYKSNTARIEIRAFQERIKINEAALIESKKELIFFEQEIFNNKEFIDEYNEVILILKDTSKSQIHAETYRNRIAKLQNEIKKQKEIIDHEDIVSLVFECYDKVEWPAELIVRVPQMIVQYQNNPQRLNELRVTFKDLFDYYNDVVVTKINKTLSMLEKLFNNSSEIKHNDLTDAYKAKIHHSNVKFQGVDVKFNELVEDKNSEIFQHLTNEQIGRILIKNESFSIGCTQEIKTKFYVERDFIDSLIDFENIEKEWNNKLKKYVWTKEFFTNLISFDQISLIAVSTKMILLSDHAGATTFKHLSMKFKNKFPHYWISFVDLKRHLKVYKKFGQDFQVLEVILEVLSITDEFEVQIFTKLFYADRVILLYDGVDEIAPKFKDFFINFIESVRNSTNNLQWMATRPQHMQELKDKFNQKAYKLMPYDDNKKIKFIENVLENMNVENIKAEDVLKDINKMTIFGDKIDSPLMLHMMTELYVNDKKLLIDSNKFSLYDRMIEIKKDIVVEEKGKIVNNDRDNRKAKLTIWQIHQIYALKLLLKDGFDDSFNDYKKIDINEFQLLKRWKKEKSNWTSEAISRYGFLFVDHWNTDDEFPDFVHRSFAEYFVAQFLIQDLYELDEDDDDEMSENEIEMRTKLLTEIGFVNVVMRKFISSFVDIHKPKKMHKNFFKLITSNEMQNILKNILDTGLVQFLSIDERFLKKFRLNGYMTIFQYAINEKFFVNIYQIVNIYKSSLGADWINHTGYSVKENFLMPNYEEIYEILKQDSKKYTYKPDETYSELKKFFKFFNSIDQLEIPQNHLLKFFGRNSNEICNYTFDSSLLTQNLMKFIQNNFHDCKREFLKTIIKNIEFKIVVDVYTDDYVIKFFHDLEDFFLSDETICVDEIVDLTLSLYLHYCRVKILINSYKESKFTKSEIQYFFIKHSVEIINYMSEYGIDSGTSIEDFLVFFKEIFAVQSERNQLKKFLDMLCEDESRFLRYVENQSVFGNLDNSEISFEDELFCIEIKRFKLLRTTLLELAKEIEISDEEFEKLSRRLKNEKIK